MSLTVTAPKTSEVVFERYVPKAPTKINMTVDGIEKSGKSYFALTAPGPISYHDLDFGLHGVADKFPDIELYHFEYPFSITNRLPGAEASPPLIERSAALWKDLVRDVMASTERCRTVVFDQGTRMWNLLRLARLGKLTQVPALQYVNVNSEFDDFIQRVHRSPANIIWLHRMKPVYEKNEKTALYERAGYDGLGYDVDVVLQPFYDPKAGFTLRIAECRANRKLDGTVLNEAEISFAKVASLIYPNSEERNWI